MEPETPHVEQEAQPHVEQEAQPHAEATPHVVETAPAEPASSERPHAVAPYALTLSDDIPAHQLPDGYAETLSSAADVLAKAGVDRGIGQRLVDLYVDTALDLDYQRDITDQFAEQDCVNALQREWGEKYTENLKLAKATANRLGDGFKQWLDETRLGNHPAMLVALARYASGAVSFTKDSAQRALDALMRDPAFTKPGSSSDGRRRAAQIRTLLRIVHEDERTPSRPAAPAPASVATDKAKARSEANAMMADRSGALMNKSHPDHAQAVKRFHELTAQL